MKIIKQDDETLIVPQAIENDGVLYDIVLEIKPGSEEYEIWLQEYTREKELTDITLPGS